MVSNWREKAAKDPRVVEWRRLLGQMAEARQGQNISA